MASVARNAATDSVFSSEEKKILAEYVEAFRVGDVKQRRALLVESILPRVKKLNSGLNHDQWKLLKYVSS